VFWAWSTKPTVFFLIKIQLSPCKKDAKND